MVAIYDAVLIGSGHNCLVAAVLLAKAGWKVGVFESAEAIGGATRSAELTLPGFKHDVGAGFHVLFLFSPFYRRFRDELKKHGLDYKPFSTPMAAVYPDGSTLCLHRELKATMDSLSRESVQDADAWRALCELYRRLLPDLVTLFGSPLPSAAAMAALGAARLKLGADSSLAAARMITMSARAFATHFFESPKTQAWFVAWAAHADHSPDTAGGGFFSWIFAAAAQDPESGLAVPAGGSGQLAQALASFACSLGAEVHTGARVTRIIVEDGAAKGVELADGTRVEAARAVIAGVTPTGLFGDLVEPRHLPGELLAQVRRYRYGLSLLKIDLALARPLRWKAGEHVSQAGFVHVGPSVDGLARAYTQAAEGLLPAQPFLFLGQQGAVDPSRAPAGKATLWIVAKFMPPEVKGDAAGRLSARPWRHLKAPYADRVLEIIEGYAPGLRESVLARRVTSPQDLEEMNANLVNGDPGAGSTHLDQLYIFRPVPNCSRYATPIKRLYLTGASTHPGPAVHGFPGQIVADMLLS